MLLHSLLLCLIYGELGVVGEEGVLVLESFFCSTKVSSGEIGYFSGLLLCMLQ